jgi:diadenosine tetraphosphate (Ap4A) HIT family hydrolase
MSPTPDCLLCDPSAADREFSRTRLWEDELWRLSAVLAGPVVGFAHLEPKRHIPYVTELDGPEAATFGGVLQRVTLALKTAAGADKTYVYVFGDHVPHLHLNLAPHITGDALRGGPGLLDPGHADADVAEHVATADRARLLLSRPC